MRKLAIGLAAASVSTLGWLGITPTVASADTQSQTFATPGALDWQVPAGVTCATFDVYGADGGKGGDNGIAQSNDEPAVQPKSVNGVGGGGGLGGRITATIQVTAGETIVISVGFNGNDGSATSPDFGTGGAVGGGDGGGGFGSGSGGGGGGGASDIRQGGSALAKRVIVAGGGGGGGAGGLGGNGGQGGDGGQSGTTGDDGLPAGTEVQGQGFGGGGGTSSSGGTAGGHVGNHASVFNLATAGTSGQGGTGGFDPDGGGGGGGGYFGGGGGGAGYATSGAGGGGGSSFGPAGAPFHNGVGADNDGNGKVVVTYAVGDTSCVPPPAAAPVNANPSFTG